MIRDADEIRPGRSEVRFTRNAIELLIVRPGDGAWGALAGDGRLNDRRDGVGIVPLSDLPNRRGGRPLDLFAPGDVIAAIDPDTLEFFVTTISPR